MITVVIVFLKVLLWVDSSHSTWVSIACKRHVDKGLSFRARVEKGERQTHTLTSHAIQLLIDCKRLRKKPRAWKWQYIYIYIGKVPYRARGSPYASGHGFAFICMEVKWTREEVVKSSSPTCPCIHMSFLFFGSNMSFLIHA